MIVASLGFQGATHGDASHCLLSPAPVTLVSPSKGCSPKTCLPRKKESSSNEPRNRSPAPRSRLGNQNPRRFSRPRGSNDTADARRNGRRANATCAPPRKAGKASGSMPCSHKPRWKSSPNIRTFRSLSRPRLRDSATHSPKRLGSL